MSAGLNTITPKIDVDAAIENAVSQLSSSDASIADMRKHYMPLKVSGIDDEAGLVAISTARKEVKSLRCKIEKRGKELRADATRFGKAVLDEVKRLKEEIEPIETHLIEQENFVQRENDRIAAEAEEARQKKTQARVDRLNAAKCRVEVQLIKLMDNEEFEEYFAEEEAKVLRVEKEQEAERQRLDEERKKLETERAKILTDQEAERKTLDAERAEIAEKQKAEEARLTAIRDTEDAERKKLEEQQREANEKQEAELQRLRKIEADRAAAEENKRQEAEQKKAEEARLKREAELKPIREQLQVLANCVANLDIPETLAAYAKDIRGVLDEAADKIGNLAD